MNEERESIEKHIKDLLKMREEYSKKSENYIQRVRFLSAEFKNTQDEIQMKEICNLHDKHKKLTQNYHKKITNLHEKISHAMKNIA